MRACIITSYPDSFTIQSFLKAAQAHDPTAQCIHIDDLMLTQHVQGNHLVHNGAELPKYDVILAMVDIFCPVYNVILDALYAHCEILVNGGDVHRNTMDEMNAYKMLQHVGVQFPTTMSVFKPEMADAVAHAFDNLKGSPFPVLVKILMNKHANGLIKADSLGSLRTIIEAFCEEEIPFTIQEHFHHRGAFSAFVFGGECLGAFVTEVADADDEFRAGMKGTPAVPAKLDELDESTLARVSNAVGRALVEVCFIKGADGRPCVMEIKPYVRMNELNHSTGTAMADDIATKLFDRLEKLLPRDEPAEPEPEPVEPDPIPTRRTIELIIHPLNDDRPITAFEDSEAIRNSIWVSELKCDDNWVSFRFRGFSYRIPRPDGSLEMASDDYIGVGPMRFTVKFNDTETYVEFYVKCDQKDDKKSGEVWILPNTLPMPKEPDVKDPEPEEQTNPEPEVEPSDVPAEITTDIPVEVPATPEETVDAAQPREPDPTAQPGI